MPHTKADYASGSSVAGTTTDTASRRFGGLPGAAPLRATTALSRQLGTVAQSNRLEEYGSAQGKGPGIDAGVGGLALDLAPPAPFSRPVRARFPPYPGRPAELELATIGLCRRPSLLGSRASAIGSRTSATEGARFPSSRPAPTTTTGGFSGCFDEPKNTYRQIQEDDGSLRRLTVEDALALSGFPLDYRFPESASDAVRWRMIGNAVPPPMAEARARSLGPRSVAAAQGLEKLPSHRDQS
jgi:hypothetical protein